MRLGNHSMISLMRFVLHAFLPLVGLALLPGCSGSASDEELGEIHYKLPPIDGMETRYYLPPMMKAKPVQNSKADDAEEGSPETRSLEAIDDPLSSETEPSQAPSSSLPIESSPSASEADQTGLPPESGKLQSRTPEKSTAP